MAERCVYVRVMRGFKELVRSRDLDIDDRMTFKTVLRKVLEESGIEIEALDECNVAVMIAQDSKTSTRGNEIKNANVTVCSRLTAGTFITFNIVEPPAQEKKKPNTAEAEAERAARSARAMSLLMSAGKELISLPTKHDETKNLRSEHKWFNSVLDHLDGAGLRFPAGDVTKDGSGSRFVLRLSAWLEQGVNSTKLYWEFSERLTKAHRDSGQLNEGI